MMKASSFKLVAMLAAPVALSATAPALAETPANLTAELSSSSFVVRDTAAPDAPQMTSINYERLYRRLVQAGMVSQVLEYKLAVDAEGKPVGCSFSRDFRMVVTEREVCRSLLRSVTFDPARDAQGSPVAGTYEGEIEIASFFQPNR